VILTVSYIQSVRGRSQKAATYQQARKDVSGPLVESVREADSLRKEIQLQRSEFNDSVYALGMKHETEIDSLEVAAQALQDSVHLLQAAKKTEDADSASVAEAKKKLTQSKDEKVVVYYKKRYQALPKDLSQYEQRVALAEIRTETADKFKISLAELSRIRERNDLNY